MVEDKVALDLDRYVDRLNAGARFDVAGFTLAGIEDLATIAQYLKLLLRPVAPSPIFREALHARIIAAPVAVAETSWPAQHKRGLIVGAVLGSALSVAGVLAVVARARASERNAA
ncbi:MAG: hypothetical protein ACYC3S_10900 [Chloroflexota bacterium]